LDLVASFCKILDSFFLVLEGFWAFAGGPSPFVACNLTIEARRRSGSAGKLDDAGWPSGRNDRDAA
jgi:hypothetical protein